MGTAHDSNKSIGSPTASGNLQSILHFLWNKRVAMVYAKGLANNKVIRTSVAYSQE